MSQLERWLEETPQIKDSSYKYDTDDIEEELNRNESEKSRNIKLNSILSPFDLVWSFGVKTNTPIENITDKNRNEIVFATAHFGIIYDYKQKIYNKLRGHTNALTSVSMDAKGKYLVTADSGKDGTILIWDTITKQLLYSIFDIFENGPDIVKISPNAKYLVAVGGEKLNEWRVKFWLWSEGKDTPDDTITFKSKSRSTPQWIDFDPNDNQRFMIVFKYDVVYIKWLDDGKLSSPCIPEFNIKIRHYEIINDGCFIWHSNRSVISSNKGGLLVFDQSVVNIPYDKQKIKNEKNQVFIKYVKVRKEINFVRSVDGILVTGDPWGFIFFFDQNIKLLYWLDFKLKSINNISFDLCPRYIDNIVNTEPSVIDNNGNNFTENEYDDMCEEIFEIQKKCSQDASLYNKLFVVRNFFISSHCGNIYRIDYLERKCTPYFFSSNSPVASIATHNYFPYLIIAYTKGELILFNYETKQVVQYINLAFEEKFQATYLKYCPSCYNLVLGTSNGTLYFLEPILLTIKKTFRPAEFKIIKITFSCDSRQMAYFDDHKNVIFLLYDKRSNRWVFKSKIRAHYKPINDILFHIAPPYDLYTIGKDRFLIKYNNAEFCSNEELEALDISSRDRIEQKDVPVRFICYEKVNDIVYFLIADDKYKYKILNDITIMTTAVILGPSVGCLAHSPVKNFEIMTATSDGQYMVFMNHSYIGLQLLPITGNPYRYVACLGHPEELIDFRISNEEKFLFTFGKNDVSVLMWEINKESVKKMEELGGCDLEPYFCLLEDGRNGYLFQEMQDLFFYMQILQQGENSTLPRQITDSIHISGLPDLVRGCGYYPSEYEVENLIVDIKYKDAQTTGNFRDMITFTEFVELFINHRPAFGYKKKDLKKSFNVFAAIGSYKRLGDEISTEEFVSALTTLGEQFTTTKLHRCLTSLLREDTSQDDDEYNFGFLQSAIDYKTFTEDFLGLDPNDLDDDEPDLSETNSEESTNY